MTTAPNTSTPISKFVAWRNALVMKLLGCLMGWVCFVVLGEPYLLMMAMATMPH